MMTRRLFSLACGAVVALTACASHSDDAPAAQDAGPPDCIALAQSAADVVIAAIELERSCADDRDCIGSKVSAGCVDQCDRAINRSGEKNVAAARASATDNQCKTFFDNGCKLDLPQCPRGGGVKCASGKCQQS